MQRYECQDVQAVLSGLLDGELDATTSHLAEAHLSQCAPCRTVLQHAEETDDLLRATMSQFEQWPDDLDRRIRTELFGEAEAARTTHRRRRLIFAAWSGWSLAAVVVLGFGLALSQGWFGGRSTPNAPLAMSEGIGVGPRSPQVWVTPVGSETVARSIFDDDLGMTGLAADASPDAASAPRAVEVATTEAAPDVEPRGAAADQGRMAQRQFSRSALAGVESEVQAGHWMQLLASSQTQPQTQPTGSAPPANAAMSMDAGTEPQAQAMAAVVTEPKTDPATGEVLHQASVLLTVLEKAGEGSFGDVRMVQQALSSDDVLERLADARGDLKSADSVDLVNRAWSMLEWTTGSVDQDELERVKQSIAMQDLPRRLERLSDQYWN